jgi:hypothetical protein
MNEGKSAPIQEIGGGDRRWKDNGCPKSERRVKQNVEPEIDDKE